jgi:hypothetical protein
MIELRNKRIKRKKVADDYTGSGRYFAYFACFAPAYSTKQAMS